MSILNESFSPGVTSPAPLQEKNASLTEKKEKGVRRKDFRFLDSEVNWDDYCISNIYHTAFLKWSKWSKSLFLGGHQINDVDAQLFQLTLPDQGFKLKLRRQGRKVV